MLEIEKTTSLEGYHTPPRLKISTFREFFLSLIDTILQRNSNVTDSVPELIDTQIILRFPGKLIEKNKKEGKSISPSELRKYSCTLDKVRAREDHVFPLYREDYSQALTYCDAPYTLMLWFEDIPLACLSFDISALTHTLFVKQIQATTLYSKDKKRKDKKQWMLEAFDWAKVLVEVFEGYIKSQKLGTVKIKIQGAFNNEYYPKGEDFDEDYASDEELLKIRRFREIYNQTAEKLGYKETFGGNFVKTYK